MATLLATNMITLTYQARWIPAPRPPTLDGGGGGGESSGSGGGGGGGRGGGAPPGGPAWWVLDRAFNSASLLAATAGGLAGLTASDVAWDPNDPNDLRLVLPGGQGTVSLRVTKRSEAPGPPGSRRLETSEFTRQVFEGGLGAAGAEGGGEGGGASASAAAPARANPPRVTASQCFSKWHWREVADAVGADVEGAPGPTIIATQVVSSFLTPDDPGGITPASLAAGGGRPVAVYTYRLALTPVGVGVE